MIDEDNDLRREFQKLKVKDFALAPPSPDFDALASKSQRRDTRNYKTYGGLVAACFALALTLSVSMSRPVDPEIWQNAELPAWAMSTDTLLLISDRAVPSNTGFEPLDISATFGRSLTFGKGQ